MIIFAVFLTIIFIPFLIFTISYEKKKGIKNGIGKSTRICFIVFLGIFLFFTILNETGKVKKGSTVQASTINFLGKYDQSKPENGGISNMKRIKEGTYIVTYNYIPSFAKTDTELNKEIGCTLTEKLKELFNADERIKSLGITVTKPYIPDNRNKGLVWKQYITFAVDRDVLNCIDDKIRFYSELIKWSKSISEIKE